MRTSHRPSGEDSALASRAAMDFTASGSSGPTLPVRTSRPPGSFCRWGSMATPDWVRRVDATQLVQPAFADSWKRTPRSAPLESHSTTIARLGAGHVAPTKHASVVIPGAPFSEQKLTTVMDFHRTGLNPLIRFPAPVRSYRSPSPPTVAQGAPGSLGR